MKTALLASSRVKESVRKTMQNVPLRRTRETVGVTVRGESLRGL